MKLQIKHPINWFSQSNKHRLDLEFWSMIMTGGAMDVDHWVGDDFHGLCFQELPFDQDQLNKLNRRINEARNKEKEIITG